MSQVNGVFSKRELLQIHAEAHTILQTTLKEVAVTCLERLENPNSNHRNPWARRFTQRRAEAFIQARSVLEPEYANIAMYSVTFENTLSDTSTRGVIRTTELLQNLRVWKRSLMLIGKKSVFNHGNHPETCSHIFKYTDFYISNDTQP